MANPFVHIELLTTDMGKAKEFYSKLFDWKLEEAPDNYTMINVGQGTGGGMMKSPMMVSTSHWIPYVLVDDVAAATEKAKSLGATIYKGITDVLDIGRYTVIIDPTGAELALWQQLKK